jgi:hypothetical protein
VGDRQEADAVLCSPWFDERSSNTAASSEVVYESLAGERRGVVM